MAERLLVAVQETNAAEIYEAFWITELKPRLNSTIHKLEYGPQEPPDLHFAQEIKRYLDLYLLRERAQLFGSRMIDIYAQSAVPKKSAADFSQWTQDHFDQEFGQGFSLIGISQLISSQEKTITLIAQRINEALGLDYLRRSFDAAISAIAQDYYTGPVEIVINDYIARAEKEPRRWRNVYPGFTNEGVRGLE